LKEFLSNNGIEYDYIDITESMRNLKIYLKLRDTRAEFDEIKKLGRVGIPFVMLGNGERLIFDEPDPEELRQAMEG
jgi:glutaredoxin-related protein